MNDLLAALKETTAFVIAERDSFYENCSESEGHVPDERDREELARIDKIIDQAQAAIAESD